MRRVVLAALAAVVGFGLYLFWAGGRGVATSPAPETVTEATPAEAAAGVATKAADAAAEEAAAAGTAAEEAGGRELESEIQGLVNQAVQRQAAPAATGSAPSN